MNSIAVIRIQFGSDRFDLDEFAAADYALVVPKFVNLAITGGVEIFEVKLSRNVDEKFDFLMKLLEIKPKLEFFTILFFDLVSPFKSVIPPTLELRVCEDISNYLTNENSNAICAIRAKEFSIGKEALRKMFNYQIEKKSIEIYESNQAIISACQIFMDAIPSEIVRDRKHKANFELFKKKLVRKIGFFTTKEQSSNEVVGIDWTFYDASDCLHELVYLLENYIQKFVPKESGEKIVVLFHTSESDWLLPAIQNLNFSFTDLKIIPMLNFLATNEFNEIVQREKNVFMVYPMVKTFSTLKKTFEAIEKKKLDSQDDFFSKINILSILYSGVAKSKNSKVVVRIGSRETKIDYFLAVSKPALKIESWESKYLNQNKGAVLAISDSRSEIVELSAYEFWHIVNKLTLGGEIDSPLYRSKLDNIPDLQILFAENGAWLCKKLIGLIKHQLNDDNFTFKNYLIVTPDQKNINTITDYLLEFSDFDIIRLDNNVIEKETAIAEDSELYSRLAYYDTEVILIDDFSRTGEKLFRIGRLLESVGKKIITSIVLFDFRDYDAGTSKLLSLYQIPILGTTE